MYGMPQPGRHDWQPCVCADEALQFLHQYAAGWSGNVSVMAIAEDGSVKTKSVTADRINELGPFIEARNGICNLYFSVNPLSANQDRKATKGRIAALAYLHADLDPRDGFDLDAERDRIRRLIDEFPISPNLIIESGGGDQVFWRLREPVLANGNIEQLEGYSRSLAVRLGADHCWNIDRMMRLPGTVNLPDAYKRARGRQPAFAQVVHSDRGAYALEDFDALLGGTEGAQAQGERRIVSVDALGISESVKQLIRQGLPKGKRSEGVFGAVRAMVKGGHSDDEIAAVLMDPCNGLNEKPRENGMAWLLGEIKRARKKADREGADARQGDDATFQGQHHSHGPSGAPSDSSATGRCSSRQRSGTTEPRFKSLSDDDVLALPSLIWCVRDVLPAQGLAALYGESGAGKSFLALDMAAAIAEGCNWFGRRVKATPVLYVALEGEAGFKARLAAWKARHRCKFPKELRFVLLQPFKLTAPEDVKDLAAIAPAGAVVFLDTLNRAAPTADENTSKDMGAILEAAKRLQSLTAGLVVLIHHTGKDATKGLRGHSSLIAALDAAIEVSGKGDRREWKVFKTKDAADGDSHAFTLQVETVGFDDYGDPITSCVVVPNTADQDVQRVKLPQGGNQRLVLEAIRPMFKSGETGKAGAPPMRPCIELGAAIAVGAEKLSCRSDRRNSRAKEAIQGLVNRGVLGLNEGWLWLG